MKNIASIIVIWLIGIFLIQYRVTHIETDPKAPLKVTDWDCLGYYMYLPGAFIYNDLTKLQWIPEIDQKYRMSGGNFYQASQLPNGNYAGKYFIGIAIMQIPFFLAAHAVAKSLGYPDDGFSPPYQWAVACAAIFWAMFGLFLLRRFLLYYFKDREIAISLLLITLATNFIQYAAVDSGLSHAYLFGLYPLILHLTKRWHEKPSPALAAFIGYVIGFATMCRPTEAVMLFIPLMWNTHSSEAAKTKWLAVKSNRSHLLLAVIGGLAGLAPQLIYWKYVTGAWIYDVGSAWDFLTPHFRVLFGWEKGWFIYTPITIFFIVGMFFIKPYQFRKSVLWFCLLNIYIIISWRDWKYGGSFSTRALVQSYPVFALPFTAFIQYANTKKWKWIFYIAGIYLVGVNIFQHHQYFKTILHYNDMNQQYYGSIYLNPTPTALDMSMLDNEDLLKNKTAYSTRPLLQINDKHPISSNADVKGELTRLNYIKKGNDTWIKVDCRIKLITGFWNGNLHSSLLSATSEKHNYVRLVNPLYDADTNTTYSFYIHVPESFKRSTLSIYITSPENFEGMVEYISLKEFSK